MFCVCRHAGACLTLEPEFLSQHSKGEDGGECVVGGKEWIGSTGGCLLLAKSSSSPGSRWGWGDTLSICCLAGAWAVVQSRSTRVEKLSL